MSAGPVLFQNVIVVGVPGDDVPFVGWVAVRDGRIYSLGAGTPPDVTGFAEVIDGKGGVLMPGIVNTHAHSHSSLTRGSAEGAVLEDWLTVIEREQSILTDDEAHVGAMATYGEALLSGTTTIMDMCVRPKAAYEAALQAGIRAVIAPYAADSKPFAPTLADTEALIMLAETADPRVRVWVGLHDVESCSDAQICRGVEIARAHGVGLHLHCAETQISVSRTQARTGVTPVAHLDRLGGLGGRTLLAHGIWLDREDRDLIAGAGASIAHCPHANLKLGSGIADIPLLRAAGINVTLATDGAKANNRLDMFDVMKFASLLQKGVARNPNVLTPAEIIDAATCGGAMALDIADAGAIAEGMLADLILIDTKAFHLQPSLCETVMTNLVHAARGSDVRLTMVDGRILVRDGALVSPEHRKALDEQHRVGVSLIERCRAAQVQ